MVKLNYLGALRMPKGLSNGMDFSYGGRAIAYNPSRKSLFISTRTGHVAEISIPAILHSVTIDNLTHAEYLQDFKKITGPLSDGEGLSGMLADGEKLIITKSVYYDANNTQRTGHAVVLKDLSKDILVEWKTVYDNMKQGFVAGYLAHIPDNWWERLGGDILTGQCGIPIVSRTSWGPAAFAFDSLITNSFITAIPLVFYDSAHPTLGPWDGSNELYGGTMAMGGVVVTDKYAIFIGRNGVGEFGYGPGTSDESLAGEPVPDAPGEIWQYDPTSSDKGQHAYPYRFQAWIYPLTDFEKVANLEVFPWELIPTVIPIELPIVEPSMSVGGVTFDRLSNTIYMVQMKADVIGYGAHPLVHAFKVEEDTVIPEPVPEVDIDLKIKNEVSRQLDDRFSRLIGESK